MRPADVESVDLFAVDDDLLAVAAVGAGLRTGFVFEVAQFLPNDALTVRRR